MNLYRYSPENWQQTGYKTLLCSCIHSSLRQHAVFMAICHEYNYYHKQINPLEKRNHNIRVLWKVKLHFVSSMRRTPHKIICLGQQMSFVSYWPWCDPAEQNQNVWWPPQPRIVQIPTRRGDLLSTREGDLKPCTALDLIQRGRIELQHLQAWQLWVNTTHSAKLTERNWQRPEHNEKHKIPSGQNYQAKNCQNILLNRKK